MPQGQRSGNVSTLMGSAGTSCVCCSWYLSSHTVRRLSLLYNVLVMLMNEEAERRGDNAPPVASEGELKLEVDEDWVLSAVS